MAFKHVEKQLEWKKYRVPIRNHISNKHKISKWKPFARWTKKKRHSETRQWWNAFYIYFTLLSIRLQLDASIYIFVVIASAPKKKLNIHWKYKHTHSERERERRDAKLCEKMCTIQPINAHKMSFSVLNLLLQRMIYGRCLRVKTTYTMLVEMRTHIKWQVREVNYCCVVRAMRYAWNTGQSEPAEA